MCALMASDYLPPAMNLDAFHCPTCGAYAHQNWAAALVGGKRVTPDYLASTCFHCGNTAVWIGEILIHPAIVSAPPPHDDLPEPARSTYDEARGVAAASSRAAAALLRVCLEELIHSLQPIDMNLNSAVGKLVADGMSRQIQQAMDTLRVIGNEAVHPGTIDVNDKPAVAESLFSLVNVVVDAMITQRRIIDEMYNSLPESKRAAIEQRDESAE